MQADLTRSNQVPRHGGANMIIPLWAMWVAYFVLGAIFSTASIPRKNIQRTTEKLSPGFNFLLWLIVIVLWLPILLFGVVLLVRDD